MKNLVKMLALSLVMILVLGFAFGCGEDTDSPDGGDEGTAFPEKNIRLIVPFSPGGGFDTQARGIAPFLEKHLPNNVSVVVENMDGAGGLTAAHHVWNAEPDGYTILQSQVAIAIVDQYLNPEEVEFRMDEFEWIGQYQKDIRALAVRPDLPIENWEDLVAYAEDQPVLFGTPGLGSPPYKEAKLIATVTGLPIDYVNYGGSSEIQAGFARKEVEAVNLNFNSLMRWVAEGDAKILFVWDDERHPMIPDVPTALEAGVPEDFYNEIMSLPVIGTPRAFATPPGTPEEVVDVLRQAFMDAMEDPEYKNWIETAEQIYGPIVPGEDLGQVIENLSNAVEDNLDLIKNLEQ